MLQANPALRPDEVKVVLQVSADVSRAYGWLAQGAGFLNARAAVAMASRFAEASGQERLNELAGLVRRVEFDWMAACTARPDAACGGRQPNFVRPGGAADDVMAPGTLGGAVAAVRPPVVWNGRPRADR
jgi:hypothetical protein